MANETLKAGFDAYMAKADAASAKFPLPALNSPNVHTWNRTVCTPLWISKALIMKKTSAIPANIPSPVAYSRPCIAANSGPCVCMLASPLLKNPTNGIATC